MSRLLATVRRPSSSLRSLRLFVAVCAVGWLAVTASAYVSTVPSGPAPAYEPLVFTLDEESAPHAGQVVAEQRSSDDVWQFSSARPAVAADSPASRIRGQYAVVTFNRAAFAARLAVVARDTDPAAAGVLMSLPMPDGTFQRFIVKDSPILAPELAAAFPDIKTYSAQGVDDPSATARFGWTADGFHSIHLSGETGSVYIDPYTPGDTGTYIVVNKANLQKPAGETWQCMLTGQHNEVFHRSENAFPIANGTSLRTYQLALATTGEYTTVAGGVEGAVARIATTMNRVNGIYERELAVRMTVRTGTTAAPTALIYPDAATDPYLNTSGDLAANQTTIDTVVGTANYDLGHLFGTGGGGVAALGSPCDASSKAQGLTGSSNPTGDAFDVDYVAHEIGHQFGGNHTYNGAPPDASTCLTRAVTAAYEPASGVTIQAYAGICGSQNLQRNSIDQFHVKSLDEMTAFLTSGGGSTCGTAAPTNNTPPVINGGTALPNFTIPTGTPFMLSTTATDANGDALTYTWEQYDLGSATATVSASTTDQGTGPLFRSYASSTSPQRMFPSLPYILTNANTPPPTYEGTAFAGGPTCASGSTCITGEVLPTTARAMNFQVTVRDNKSGGGAISTALMTVTTVNTGAVFGVTSHNTATTVTGNTAMTVTWNVAGTTAAPISAANVSIAISTDGGTTFTTVLASTPNNGTAQVTVPNQATTQGRVRVMGVNNIFFDINDANFTVTAGAATVPGAPTGVVATPGNAQASVAFTAPANNGGAAISSYTVTAAPGGATASGSASPLVVTGLTNGTPYTFTVTATNSVGTGPASAASAAVTPTAVTPTLVGTPSTLRFAATKNGAAGALVAVTGPQSVTVTFAGSPTPQWTATSNQPWAVVSNGSGTGVGTFSVSIADPANVIAGQTSLPATITLTAANAGTTTTVAVSLAVTQQTGTTSAPIGQVDTPAQGTTGAQGAIAMTGWVVDDVGVAHVRLYRQCLSFEASASPSPCVTVLGTSVVLLGDASVIPGARPDVEREYPALPATNAAGWGFLILSNLLPNITTSASGGGVGTFQLYAVATDQEGNQKMLGRTINDATPTSVTVANDTIAKPFGAIDTPGQGATVSGTLNNFGWALTPDLDTVADPTDILVPTAGTTVNVFIDGASVGTATYNLCRGSVAVGGVTPAGVLCDDDVSGIFRPGGRYRNLDAGRGPIGLRTIDTRTLSNGLRTIQWGVTDSAGRGEGIGSRYFTVLNSASRPEADAAVRSAGADVRSPGADVRSAGADVRSAGADVRSAGALAPAERHGLKPVSYEDIAIYGRTGFNERRAFVPVEAVDGVPTIVIPELGRVELQVPGATYVALLANGQFRDAPVGTSVDQDAGMVRWSVGLGYLGTYRLLVEREHDHVLVDVVVAPMALVDEGVRMYLDRADVHGAVFTLHGWALDPQADTGSGIGAVHIWARPRSAECAVRSAGPARRSLGEGGCGPVFMGTADLGVARPDVAAAHGARFTNAGFSFQGALDAGDWEVTAYIWNYRTGRFEDARTVIVTVK